MMPGRRKLGLTAIITLTNNLRRGDDISRSDDISISPPGCECDTLMREWPDGLLRLITVIVSLMGESQIKSVDISAFLKSSCKKYQ